MAGLITGRETLHEHEIRIGDDITRRQRATLKRLSDEESHMKESLVTIIKLNFL